MPRRVAAILLASLTACATAASSGRPPDSLPATFSQTGAAALPDRWWLAFGDAELSALVDRALAGNLDLRGQWTRLAEAEAQARGAGASRWPTLDANASGTGTVTAARDGTRSTDLAGSLGLAASYEIDLWGRVRAARDSASLSALATAYDVRTAAMTLSAQVATTWYSLVEARAEDELLKQQLARAEDTLDRVATRVRAGLAASDDEVRQQQNVEAIRGDRALAAASIAVLEHQLAVLVGAPPTERVAPSTTTLAELPPLPETGVPSQLLQRRPDVLAAFARVQAADRDVAAAIADRYPRLSLSARSSIDVPLTGWLSSLVANLTAPLFDGGARKAEVERARAAAAGAVLAYQSTLLTAAREVEDALVQEAHQAENLASLDRQLALSQRALDAAEQRYESGLADYLVVLDAQDSQQALERRRLQAQSALLANRIALYRSLAGAFD